MSPLRRRADEEPPLGRRGILRRRRGSAGDRVAESRAGDGDARGANRGGGGDGRGSANGIEGAEAAYAQEEIILDALHDLRDTVVREVMTPRVDVVALHIPVTIDAVAGAVRESGHSCFPVCGESLDDLIGVLFVNDLFRAGWAVDSAGPGTGPSGDTTTTPVPRAPSPLDISRRIRQPFLVPESHLVLDVLADMRNHRRGFAVVVDEHGGVEGVVTVKDLLGALVGDLPDEFDQDDEPEMVRVDRARWLLDGRTSVDDVRDRLGIAVPEADYDTLGGYLFDGFGHIPDEGEVLDVEGWHLRVAEMDRRRIAKVVATRLTGNVDRSEPDGAGQTAEGAGRPAGSAVDTGPGSRTGTGPVGGGTGSTSVR